jgi:DNA-binding NarL/FixJ family response regulator
MPISIVLTDDHPIVRSGYRRLISLDSRLEVVAEFDNGEATSSWLQDNNANVLIMDISMPGQGGLETLRKIRASNPQIKIIILSMHDSPSMVTQALENGANGFLSKTSDPDELIKSIAIVMDGGNALSADIASKINKIDTNVLPHESLSPKEFVVMLKLAEGLSPKEVAEALNISDKTAYNYQTKIYKKLNIENGVQLNQYIQSHRLLQ